MPNVGLGEAEAGIKITRRNINNLMYAHDNTLNGRKLRGTEEPLLCVCVCLFFFFL